MFFANGGGACYVMSVGSYNNTLSDVYRGNKNLILDNIRNEHDINLLVIPEAVNVKECMDIYRDLLNDLCGSGKYFAILDVPRKKPDEDYSAPEDFFRNTFYADNLQFAAAYYPWLETSVLSDKDIDEKMFIGDYNKLDSCAKERLVKKVTDYLNLLPPSAAVAGLYSATDNAYGVWKAPTDMTLKCVKNPEESIDSERQIHLNTPENGKSINVIRYFPGEGTKVKSARTLDGNSPQWKYVNARRTMTFLEQTIRDTAETYASEPNNAQTWNKLKCVINNFLHKVWERGGLAGAVPEDAYSVHVGLGETMTDKDILEGIMCITVMAAISNPSEFIGINIRQQMQKSYIKK